MATASAPQHDELAQPGGAAAPLLSALEELVELAEAAHAACTGDRAAVKKLTLAYFEFADQGAERLADATLQSLRRLGHAPVRRQAATSRGLLAPLTPRQLQVVKLVAAGKRNREIAAELFVSETTVERHVSRVFDRLGVSSRAAVAAIVERARAQGELASVHG